MKKLASLLLILCLLISTACAESACTLAELKATASETASFSLDDETVTIPVTLPSCDQLPILYAEPYSVNKKALQAAYGRQHVSTSAVDGGYLYINFPPSASLQGMRVYRTDGLADHNPLSPSDVSARFEQAVQDMALPLTFRVDKVLALSGGYEAHTVTKSCPDMAQKAARYDTKDVQYSTVTEVQVQEADLERPISGMERGYYELLATQTIGGVPVFRGDYVNDSSANTYFHDGRAYAVSVGGHACLHLLNESAWSLAMLGLVQPCGEINADAPLAPFDQVVSAVQARIDSGELRSIDGLELGYSAALRMPKGKASSPTYVLVPVWRVLGYDLKDGVERQQFGMTEPTAEERYYQNGDDYEVRFDARTLEPWNQPLWGE